MERVGEWVEGLSLDCVGLCGLYGFGKVWLWWIGLGWDGRVWLVCKSWSWIRWSLVGLV